jgi:hypothetical protein
MADKVKIKVKRTGRVRTPQLIDPQMKAIGEEMVAAQKERWRDAISANGVPAKKLSVKYFIEKRKYHGGGTPVRDMNMTGRTIKNFQLRKATVDKIRAENTTRNERAKAMRAQNYEEMIGFSIQDAQAVISEAKHQYGQYVRKAWIPVGETTGKPWT